MTDDPSTSEELTAYLDGELDADNVQRVERRLASDPAYLAEMQSFQKTWDLFDRLPTEQGDQTFVKTTMEIVVADAVKHANRKLGNWWIWPLRLAVFLAIPTCLFAASFFIVRAVDMSPQRELVNHVMLIENLDQYEKVDKDINFLIHLDEWGLFAEDNTFDSISTEELPSDWFAIAKPGRFSSREAVEDRKAYIESLDLEQKKELRRNYSEFVKLLDSEKDELRDFHNLLTGHPDRASLTRVMNEFYEWLKTLGLAEQAALLDLNGDRQLIEIARIKTRQAREAFGRSGATKLPTPQDAEFLFDWYELTINSKENQIRNQFVPTVVEFLRRGKRDIPVDLLSRFARRQPLNQLIAILLRIDQNMIQDLVLTDVDLLRRGLSAEARTIFDEQTVAGQRELLLNWIDSANQSKATISPERLHEFYEQLSFTDRDELDKMAPENWISSLTAKYWEYQNSQRGPNPQNEAQEWRSFLRENDLGDF